jgi:hypothetical protein
MTVHEPPKTEAETSAPSKPADQPKPAPKPAVPSKTQLPQQHLKPGATQDVPKPVGVIVTTIFVMIVLIGLTIMAYINSNS